MARRRPQKKIKATKKPELIYQWHCVELPDNKFRIDRYLTTRDRKWWHLEKEGTPIEWRFEHGP